MVPVQLQLSNFLSYGTDAPTLDFEQFHVACLSGGNGQGKSALLDAVTWALWGEARKSSGNRKPDDELIRIGTQEMQVEFVFDVEGERYRVIRSYYRSATGKTTRSDLELHLFDPDGAEGDGDYRPLTGTNQRATQAHIESTVGLDYDTFINSAFLLQGRSDEFTKKRPSERKEILTRILNLGRYEALEDRARDRWRAAKQRLEQAERAVERLTTALADADAWTADHEQVRARIEEKQERLGALRAEEKRLVEQRTALEAKAAEAEGLKKNLGDMQARLAEYEEEAEGLDDKIETAEGLIAQKEAIEEAHDRHEALRGERDALEDKRELVRGIEGQINQAQNELNRRKHTCDKRLDKLDTEHAQARQRLGEWESALAQRPSVKEKLAAARAAKQALAEMSQTRQRRDALREQCAEAKQKLSNERESLQGELRALHADLKAAEQAEPSTETLEQRAATLSEQIEARGAWREERDAVRAEGQEARAAIRQHEGQMQARAEELEGVREELERLQTVDAGVCPTCGTDLTDDHRREVEAQYGRRIETIEAALGEARAAVAKKKEERAALLEKYNQLDAQISELDGVEEQRATVRQRLQARVEQEKKRAAKAEQAEQLEAQIEEKAFGKEHRTAWNAAKEKLEALTFDEEAYEQKQTEAAQVERYEDRLRDLEEKASRTEQLEKNIRANRKQADKLRREMDDGTAFGAVQEKIQTLQQQLTDVGFDAERLQAVKRELVKLSGAGDRLKDLVNAQQNREEWKAQRRRVEKRTREAKEQERQAKKRLADLEDALDGRAALKEKLEAAAREAREVEQALGTLRTRQGELSAKLEQAKKDRAALKEHRRAFKEAKGERALYKHLRAAFGKNGIPSLIIEQTLPEIEERANRLLEQLTDGRMHIGLETLKDKKTGGTKETLDINITDEQGVVRAYETYSGGEAFRVNFALRIALAQLLAERSGVRIRTLVIDEGFGTQDPEGIQSLVEAISVVQHDFDKIVVITHLESLKQAFPTRIEVEKDPAFGSTFEVVGV